MSSVRKFFAVLAAASVVGHAGSAAAATVTSISGQVSVSRGGGGFTPITGPTEVPPGTRIMAGPGGSATVSFENFCVRQVISGTVYVVPAALPECTAGAPSDPLPTDVIIGGLAVAGVVAGVIIYNANRSSSP